MSVSAQRAPRARRKRASFRARGWMRALHPFNTCKCNSCSRSVFPGLWF